MAKLYAELDERLTKFILSQPVFFVATAPCLTAAGDGGHVNLSPKGYRDTFAILGPRQVAYLDLTGSGAETIAHLRQNGRITIMFCSFDTAPNIVRIYGAGRAVLPGQAEWPSLAAHFGDPGGERPDPSGERAAQSGEPAARSGERPGHGPGRERGSERAIIVVTADRISDSCGYSVPVMELKQERDVLLKWAERKSAEQLTDYRVAHNTLSIDGLPALGDAAPRPPASPGGARPPAGSAAVAVARGHLLGRHRQPRGRRRQAGLDGPAE